jgi:hypothetical protein
MADSQRRCVAHRYRPAPATCTKCKKGICEECNRLYSQLCPSCANVPGGGNTGVYKKNVIKKKEKAKFDFSNLITPGVKSTSALAIATVLGILLIALLVMGFMGVGPLPFRTRPLTPQQNDTLVRQTLYAVVTALDAYKQRIGEYPANLDPVGMGYDKTISYTLVSKERFIISMKRQGQEVTYDSNQDPAAFFAGLPPPINPSAGGTK